MMISLVHITIEGLEHLQGELVRQGRHIRNLTARVKKMEFVVDHMKTHALQTILIQSDS